MSRWLELKQAFQTALHGGNLAAAERALEALWGEAKARDERETTSNTYFQEGLLRDAQNRLEEAEGAFLRSVEIDRVVRGPRHAGVAEALHSVGIVRTRRGDLEGALAAYREAADITREKQPFHAASAFNAVGGALLRLGRLADAAAAYREAIVCARADAKTPAADAAYAHFGLGEALRQDKQFHEAFVELVSATRFATAKMWPRLEDIVGRAWFTLAIVSRHALVGAKVQGAFAYWFASTMGDAAVRARAAGALAQVEERSLCTADPRAFYLVYRDKGRNLHVASAAHGLFAVRPSDSVDATVFEAPLGAPVDVEIQNGRVAAVRPRAPAV